MATTPKFTIQDRENVLLATIEREATLFRTEHGTVYADVTIAGRRETMPLHGADFTYWLTDLYRATMGELPPPLTKVLNYCDGRARRTAPRKTYLRVAHIDDLTYGWDGHTLTPAEHKFWDKLKAFLAMTEARGASPAEAATAAAQA